MKTSSSARRRLRALLILPIIVALVGCSQIQTAVSDGAQGVADSAAATASAELTKRICAPLTDGTISAEDRARLTDLLALAEESGLATDLIDSMRKVADSGTEVSATDVTAFVEACDTAAS
ncbi:MAG: hypothetical protein LH475_00495 [Cryobacterium sp.]|uniref:hypothetical protein n=1 Tax=unclassified Cryobacterium TaxID=2649013 RepID=UPI0018C9FB55|nr:MULTISPECIES: hypothetical protein [unclassified Cryobacterium]MCY7403114.1 hypothetical protein [Cryobacterium sp.]MEC5152806.1 hypothetical protein [Cryobacterium sp. CAN_C3]